MSDSRLEKFIYAICSMDVTDLPVPLSRIEKLWNCLITGETPDFEPLSRNEKYLMAILDRYDISNLPAPMSRGEKLLYKIAVGETDLSDVPGYLSRYEELLKYLIENGGIGGGDFEYVLYTINQSLYTLYTTAKKPVKSAILKGQTLVNLFPSNVIDSEVGFCLYREVSGVFYQNVFNYQPTIPYQQNKKYLIKYWLKNVEGMGNLNIAIGSNNLAIALKNGESCGVIELTKGIDSSNINFRIGNAEVQAGARATLEKAIILEYQDGMENWDIPYFEGMQSVKMPVLTTVGKNLFDKTKFLRGYYVNESTGALMGNGNNALYSLTDFIEIQPNKTLTNNNIQTNTRYAFYDKNKTFINGGIGGQITSPPNAKYLRWSFAIDSEESYQIEYGSVRSSYEPFKSNILTVNEEVELRSVGDIKDTLDCMTGQMTKYIGDITLKGGEGWTRAREKSNTVVFYSTVTNQIAKKISDTSKVSEVNCDKLPSSSVDLGSSSSRDVEGCYIAFDGNICIAIAKSKLTSTGYVAFNQYLQSNPLTVYFELATPINKTVELTVLNQDNQPTQLGTFENVTHVSLESAGLIPEVEMEVATRISKELASASPLMDDISTKQEQLNTTVDEQSENVDATMIATTEIYEETL